MTATLPLHKRMIIAIAMIMTVAIGSTAFDAAVKAEPAHAVTIHVTEAAGFTMHANFNTKDWATHIGLTLQPETVHKIDWIIHLYDGIPFAATQEALATLACVAFTDAFAPMCAILLAAFGAYMVTQFDNANALDACVTVKIKFPLFSPYFYWDGFPYVDAGSWCNRHHYTTPPEPPAPHYNGPLSPPCLPFPQCNV